MNIVPYKLVEGLQKAKVIQREDCLKLIQAFSLLMTLFFLISNNVDAEPSYQKSADKGMITEVVTLGKILELGKSVKARDIDKLANNLHFSYRSLGCHPTNDFSDFCQYQVDSNDPTFGQMLILALGHDKVSGKTGGRVIWATPQDGNCLSKSTVLSLLGAGQPKAGDIAEPIAGYIAPPVEREDYLHQSIPGGIAPARAVISYLNGCINQMFLDF